MDPSILRRARRRRATRLVLTAIAVAVAASAGTASAASAQVSGTLSPARFAAFDTMYTALVTYEDYPSPAALAEARRVCDALDRSDRLLAITRRGCRTSLKSVPAFEAYAACETRRGCRTAARRLRIVLNETLVDIRASNRIVAAEVAPGPCRKELTASRALMRTFEMLRDGLRLLERGLLTRRRATIRRAEARIAAAALELAQQPSGRSSQETFRRACAPPG